MRFGHNNESDHRTLRNLGHLRVIRIRKKLMWYMAPQVREVAIDAPLVLTSDGRNTVWDELLIEGTTVKGRTVRLYGCPFSHQNLEGLRLEIALAESNADSADARQPETR